ncbi:MAG: 4-hydroxybenzoate octaprenyltransferase [Pseudomonadota bacterium]
MNPLPALVERLQSRWPRLPDFIHLTRLDRPIGIFVLLWPTLGALWIAGEGRPALSLVVVFTLGTIVMRAAGCCINDFADSHVDGDVLRTEGRPIVTGRVSRNEALQCFLILTSIGAFLLLFTNRLTFLMAFGALALASVYPFMKRYTHLPQVVLGMAFSWAILMAFTAQTDALPPEAWLLYVANCLWTVAYDTQYAMVDREYDLKIGVKSTAILFGDADRAMIAVLQLMFLGALLLAGLQFQLGAFYYLGLIGGAGLLGYQQWLIRDRDVEGCFRAFLNNHWVGLVIFVGVILGT